MGRLELDTPVQYVKGVGPVRAEQLAGLGVCTAEDLLTYYPRRFDLRKQAQSIGSLVGGEKSATVAGEVVAVEERRTGRKPFLSCQLRDETGWVLVKWFHGNYLRQTIMPGVQIAVSGKVSVYREHLQLVNPRLQVLWDPSGTDLNRDELMPVYPAGGNLTSAMIARIIRQSVLPYTNELIRENLPEELLRKRCLPARSQAVAAMHRPEDKQHWQDARRRLAYDECLLLQLGMAILRSREISRPAHPLEPSAEIDRRIRARFPFTLTAAQDKAVREIAADLSRPRPMNRLLQGDVGSGKTVVALYATLLTVAHRCQAAIMAPTEILASQHYGKITEYLRGSQVRTELLVGGRSAKSRAEMLQAVGDGRVHLIVGTHALLSEGVKFSRLGLVVVDEQHKFGVRQRTGIRGKGYAPHYLVMTATPIPRTLALTVFGDLDVSTIDALPPGRGKTETRVVPQSDMDEVLATVRRRLQSGQQAYFIYPLVSASEESPEPDDGKQRLTSAEDAYRDLATGPLKNFRVGLIHGQMPADRKEAAMADFHAGKVQALVASVVVEVGMDVPAANVMVVMHAERFGLAQLHQLRGRIGRGEDDALCLLVASGGGEVAQRRLEVLSATNDGFRIAEEDLRIRGPGEFFGTRQHGLPELKVADLIEDFELLREARADAFDIVAHDGLLEAPHHQHLRRQMLAAYSGKLDLLMGA